MPLSTSNSNNRLWPARWLRIWVIAVALAVLLLGGWEGFWRARGFAPRPNDDVGWWARERTHADQTGPQSVVLVGSSRMQLGFDTQVFAQKTGIHPIQLAIDGDTGIDVLQDLAADPNFRGTVICELMEKYVVALGRDAGATQAGEWLHQYHASNLFNRFEWRARGVTQTAFAFRLPDLSLQNLAANLRLRQLPPPPYVTVDLDRSKQADYARADVATLRSRHLANVTDEYAHMLPLSSAEFVARGQQLADWTARIEARGGHVIFVRFPTSGEVRQLEVARFPQAEYWDALVAGQRLTALHFANYDSMKDFTCPDGTHLDYRDAARFTAALTDIMLQKKLLPPGGGH